MATFHEANQARLELKMKLSNYCWYDSSAVIINNDGFGIVIIVDVVDNKVRKVIPPTINGVSIKTESK